jgi:circadian clock protein KaiC
MFGMQFIVNGIREGEPAVFVTFEESREKLVSNMRSVGIDLEEFERKKRLVILPVLVQPGEMMEVGDYTLDGLFVRLDAAIKGIKAKRVALDTIESLFAGFENHKVLRNEFKRLFNWLEARGVSSIVTGEKGETMCTRHNLEEYLADCVVFLDHRVQDQISTRRLRVIKYRGTGAAHGERVGGAPAEDAKVD